MTEKEKMLAGMVYSAVDKQLYLQKAFEAGCQMTAE